MPSALCVLGLFSLRAGSSSCRGGSDVNMLCTQTLGNARCVHCDIADDTDIVEVLYRRHRNRGKPLRRFTTGKKLVSRVNAEEVLAVGMQESGQTGAGAVGTLPHSRLRNSSSTVSLLPMMALFMILTPMALRFSISAATISLGRRN